MTVLKFLTLTWMHETKKSKNASRKRLKLDIQAEGISLLCF